MKWKDSHLHELFYKSVVKQDKELVVDCLSHGANVNRHFPIVSIFKSLIMMSYWSNSCKIWRVASYDVVLFYILVGLPNSLAFIKPLRSLEANGFILFWRNRRQFKCNRHQKLYTTPLRVFGWQQNRCKNTNSFGIKCTDPELREYKILDLLITNPRNIMIFIDRRYL